MSRAILFSHLVLLPTYSRFRSFRFGMPALLFVMMNKVKTLIMEEDPEVLKEFGFVLQDYKLSHWYWEVVSAQQIAFLCLCTAFSRCRSLVFLCLLFADGALRLRSQVELARKLILSGVIGLFRRGSITQIVLATFLSFVFTMLSYRQQPYNTARLNFIKVASEAQLVRHCLSIVCSKLPPRWYTYFVR